MKTKYLDLLEILPEKIRTDEESLQKFLSLLLNSKFAWWKPIRSREDYLLLKDLTVIFKHYSLKQPIDNWQPSSKLLVKSWETYSDWDNAWEDIEAKYIVQYKSTLWCLAIVYSHEISSRNETYRWVVSRVLGIISILVAITVAIGKLAN